MLRSKPPFNIKYNNPDNAPSASSVAGMLNKALVANPDDLTVAAFMDNNASLAVGNESGYTVTHNIVENTRDKPRDVYETLTRALDSKAPVDTADSTGKRPLHLAADRQDPNIVRLLLKRGADPNAVDHTGRTALHNAVTPNTVKCEPRGDAKCEGNVGEFEEKPKMGDDTSLDDLKKYVYAIMRDNDHDNGKFIKYVEHLGMMGFANALVAEDPSDEEEARKILQETLVNSKKGITGSALLAEMRRRVKDGFNKRVYERSLTQYTTGLRNATFKADKDKGWGPLDDAGNLDVNARVLADLDSGDQLYNIAISQKVSDARGFFDKIGASTTSISNGVNSITAKMDTIKELFAILDFVIAFEKLDTGLTHPANLQVPTGSPPGTAPALAYPPGPSAGPGPGPGPTIIDNSKGITFKNQNIKDAMEHFSDDIMLENFTGKPSEVYPNTLMDSQMIDLQALPVFPPHNKPDNLDYVKGIQDPASGIVTQHRSLSDAIRYYISQLTGETLSRVNEGSSAAIEALINNNAGLPPMIEEIAKIQAYSTQIGYLLILIDQIMNLLKEKIQDFKSDNADNIKLLLKRFNNAMDSKNHTRDGSHDVYYYDRAVRLTKDNDNIVYFVNQYGGYLILKNKRSGETYLTHADIIRLVRGGNPSDRKYYDRQTAQSGIHNIIGDKIIRVGPNQYRLTIIDGGPQVGGLMTPKRIDYTLDVFDKAVHSLTDGIASIYSDVSKIQVNLKNAIESINRWTAINAIRRFHNNMSNTSYDDINTAATPYLRYLKTPLPLNKMIPKGFEFLNVYVKKHVPEIIAMEQNTIDNLIMAFVNDYFYHFDGAKDVVIVSRITPAVPFVSGFLPSQDYFGNPPPIYANPPGQAAVVNEPRQLKRIVTDPIIREVMGDHMEYIKYQMIMWVMQKVYTEQENLAGGVVGSIENAYTRYAKLSMNVRNDQTAALIAVGKIVDEIVIETFKKLLRVGTSIYSWKTIFPNVQLTQEETAMTRIFGDSQINLMGLGIYVDAYAYRGALGDANTKNYNLFAQSLIVNPDRVDLSDAELSSLIRANKEDDIRHMSRPFREYDQDVGEQIRRLVNPDATDDDICYRIDEQTAVALLDAGSDPNAKDAAKKTPLDYAVLLQNMVLIRELLERGAGVNLSMYGELVKELGARSKSSPILNLNTINRTLAKHLVDKFCVKRIPDKAQTVLPMAMYMFDHQLTVMANRYVNNYDTRSLDALLELIGFPAFNGDELPLSMIDNYGESSIRDNKDNNAAYNDQIEYLDRKICTETDNLARLRNQRAQIDSARGSPGISASLDDAYDEIFDLVTRLQTVIAELNTDLDDLRTNRDDYNDPASVQNAIDSVKAHRVQNYSIRRNRYGVAQIYDDFFINGLNQGHTDNSTMEYVTYYKMWNAYLKIGTPDYTQLTRAVQAYLAANVKDIDSPDKYREFYGPIKDIYTMIYSKYGEDYFDMSMYLNDSSENYALKQIYEIMCHVFKHTMAVDLVNLTAGLLARKMDKLSQETAIFTVFEIMVTSGFLIDAIDNVPKRVVKSVCKMSSGPNDPQASDTVESILRTTFDMLDISYFNSIDESTLKKLKTDVTEYYTEYMSTYTAEMHSVLIKQLKSLMRQAKLLEVIDVVSGKLV